MSHNYNLEDYSEDKIQKAFRDYEDVASDLSSSNYKTFNNNLRQYFHVINTNKIISQVISNKLPDIDFQTWYSEAKATVGGMVGSGHLDWPLEKPQKLAHQLELLEAIAEGNENIINFCHKFMYVDNNFDSMTYEFIRQIVDPFTRDIKRLIEDEITVLSLKVNTYNSDSYIEEPKAMIKLFISHSSKDQKLVEKLIELVKNALRLSSKEIRCTTIDGYRLPGGAKTNEQLKREVRDSNAFIGLISAAATDSMYVLFELGARWGSDKHLLPLLAPSVSPDILKGPLSELNALSCENSSQLQQLVQDLADVLKIKPENPAAYQRYIDGILAISPSVVKTPSGDDQTEVPSAYKLTDVQLQILKAVADMNQREATVAKIARVIALSDMEAKYNLDELNRKHKLLDWIGNMNRDIPDCYVLTHEGRGFVLSLRDG